MGKDMKSERKLLGTPGLFWGIRRGFHKGVTDKLKPKLGVS